MKDEFDELVEELHLDEIPDFDAKSAWYQVWLLGYDKDQNIVDWDCFIDESRDPDKMIERAKTFIAEKQYEGLAIPEEVVYLEVLVETVVNIEGYDENIGTLFDETIKK